MTGEHTTDAFFCILSGVSNPSAGFTARVFSSLNLVQSLICANVLSLKISKCIGSCKYAGRHGCPPSVEPILQCPIFTTISRHIMWFRVDRFEKFTRLAKFREIRVV